MSEFRKIVTNMCREAQAAVFVFTLLLMSFYCRTAYAEQQISQFGITWTFDADYTVGQFANDDYWVVGPVTIASIQPASIVIGERTINGSMVNPSPVLGRQQGYDSSMYGKFTRPGDYDPNLNAARPNGQDLSPDNPLILQPDSSLVSTISIPEAGNSPQLKTAAVLTVLRSPAAAGSFRPPYAGYDKAVRFNEEQLDYSIFANLKPVPGTPDLSSVERYFERVWLDHIPWWLGRTHHPSDNMEDYDRDICTQEGIGALMLNLNFKIQQKRTLFVRYVQVGIDNFGVIQSGGRDNWRQDSGRKFPILLAGLALNDPNMKNIGSKSGDYAYTVPYGPDNPPADLVRFEEDETTFYVSDIDINMSHSSEWKPDTRAEELIPYSASDLELPEWGLVRLYDRTGINKAWEAQYRKVIGQAYGGLILAVHAMGAKELWNHDAFFDYNDRYMQVETDLRQTSQFVERMWDTYRNDYGPAWTMSPTLNITATGGSVIRVPEKAMYNLGEKVRIKAIPEAGYEFKGWSDGLTAQANPAEIIMYANRSITANFAVIQSSPVNSK